MKVRLGFLILVWLVSPRIATATGIGDPSETTLASTANCAAAELIVADMERLNRSRVNCSETEKTNCHQPGLTLCDENKNQALQKSKASELELQLMSEALKSEPQIMDLLKAENVDDCGWLSLASFEKCKKIQMDSLNKKIYTSQRKVAAQALFEQAKGAAVKYAAKYAVKHIEKMRHSKPPKSPSSNQIEALIEKIKSAELHFGDQYGNLPSYNASASNKDIYLGGLIMAVDYAPESLIHTFLHELGHFIDVDEAATTRLPSQTLLPFAAVADCLKGKDSIGAKPTDVECLRGLAKGKSNSNIFPSSSRDTTAMSIRAEIAQELVTSSPNCQASQVKEALSDWFAVEVISDQFLKKASKQFNISNTTMMLCQSYMEQQRMSVANLGAHPTDVGRVDRLFAVHPEVRKALGCTKGAVMYCESKK